MKYSNELRPGRSLRRLTIKRSIAGLFLGISKSYPALWGVMIAQYLAVAGHVTTALGLEVESFKGIREVRADSNTSFFVVKLAFIVYSAPNDITATRSAALICVLTNSTLAVTDRCNCALERAVRSKKRRISRCVLRSGRSFSASAREFKMNSRSVASRLASGSEFSA